MRTTTAATAVTAAFVAGMLVGPTASTADETQPDASCQVVSTKTRIVGARWQNHRPTYTARTRIVTATTTLCDGEYDTHIAVRRTDDAPRILFR